MKKQINLKHKLGKTYITRAGNLITITTKESLINKFTNNSVVVFKGATEDPQLKDLIGNLSWDKRGRCINARHATSKQSAAALQLLDLLGEVKSQSQTDAV